MCVCVCVCVCACTHIILRMCLLHSVLEKLVKELDIQNYEVVCCRNENLKTLTLLLHALVGI